MRGEGGRGGRERGGAIILHKCIIIVQVDITRNMCRYVYSDGGPMVRVGMGLVARVGMGWVARMGMRQVARMGIGHMMTVEMRHVMAVGQGYELCLFVNGYWIFSVHTTAVTLNYPSPLPLSPTGPGREVADRRAECH